MEEPVLLMAVIEASVVVEGARNELYSAEAWVVSNQ
jgi:hypothetical protein